MGRRKEDMDKKSLAFLVLLMSCSDITNTENEEYQFQLNPRLEMDKNGYYHLDVLRQNRQTLHRINGIITKDDVPVENVFFEWNSNLSFVLGDTLGYIIRRNFNDRGTYVSVDTSYMIGFEGHIVPSLNCCSYSNTYGEVNVMIGLFQQAIGDTMIVNYSFINRTHSIGIVLD